MEICRRQIKSRWRKFHAIDRIRTRFDRFLYLIHHYEAEKIIETYKSYVDPKDNRYEASLEIYEVSSEQVLVDNIETCIAFIKNMNWQSVLRIGRFLLIFNPSVKGDGIKFSNDENRAIFENFYLSKGAKIVYQAPTDKQEFYFYEQE